MKQQPTLGHYAYCGEINGKNSFGAYSGFQPFAVVPPQAEKGQWFVELTDIENGIGFIWLTNCEEDGKPVEGQPVSFEE